MEQHLGPSQNFGHEPSRPPVFQTLKDVMIDAAQIQTFEEGMQVGEHLDQRKQYYKDSLMEIARRGPQEERLVSKVASLPHDKFERVFTRLFDYGKTKTTT